MSYVDFANKVNALKSILEKIDILENKDTLNEIQAQELAVLKTRHHGLVEQMSALIEQGPLTILATEYQILKSMKQESILRKLWHSATKGKIPFELWDLEVAASCGNLEVVIELLEDENLQQLAASNGNRVLRRAALGNHHEVVAFLMNIKCIKEYGNVPLLIQSPDQRTANSSFYTFLRGALNFPGSADTYLASMKELISTKEIIDLDWRYLANILALKNVTNERLKEVVSFISILPSARIRILEDQDFRNLMGKVRSWLKGKRNKPVPDDVPRVGPHVVKLGVSAFNLVAYEKFLDEKAVADKLREHYTEDQIQKFYPGRFPRKDNGEFHQSITIENNRITQAVIRRGPVKPN
ncbi:MAG: hypothetical protein JSR17_09330 [Proteobacteria bacterium]|nr:hypothetical protein [Pseudomonadota bacterium]